MEEAKVEKAGADKSLAEAQQALAEAPVLEALRALYEGIKDDARPYLGALIPADIGEALREQMDDKENPDWVLALRHLRDVLASNDLRPPVVLEPEDLIAWVVRWLDSADATDTDPADSDETVGDIEAQLVESKQVLARHHRALAKIGRLEQAAARSTTRLAQLKQHLTTRTESSAASTAGEVVGLVKPVADQIQDEVGGSVPIVVVGSMAELSDEQVEAAMDSLEQVAQRAQIIMVTPCEAAIRWATEAGQERAGVSAGTAALL